MIFDVIVIGGGAAGLMAAVKLSAAGLSVAVLEKSARVGKKLLMTGGGKCNLLNLNIDKFSYNTNFADGALKKFPPEKLTEIFKNLGVPTFSDGAGRVYPVSESAASVLNIFLMHLDKNKAEIFTDFDVLDIKFDGNFTVNNSLKSKYLLFATGSPATVGFDSLQLLKPFGHEIVPFSPSLCPVKVPQNTVKGLKNMRLKAKLQFDGFCEEGEIQFKEDGVSGILSFQLSELLNRKNSPLILGGSATTVEWGPSPTIDFIPALSEEAAQSVLDGVGAYGLFHPQTARAFEGKTAAELKDFKVSPAGFYPMSAATIAHGGLNTGGFYSESLQSKKVKNLYAAGEALDVSGLSGGYNLMWAWASALAVSEDIIRRAFMV